jgi:hypothetical protein
MKQVLVACSVVVVTMHASVFFTEADVSALTPEVTFTPRPPLPGAGPKITGSLDFMALFDPNAAWKRAARRIKIFEIDYTFLERATDVDLSKIFADLRRRKIALALGGGILSGASNCGRNVEGYSATDKAAVDFRRIKNLGGMVDYVVMDEPFYYGHIYSGKNACRSSTADLAKDIASRFAEIRKLFPDAELGDVEPIPSIEGGDWLEETRRWIKLVRAMTGRNLAFFRADIAWWRPWQEQILPLKRLLREENIKFAVIYNGNSDAESDGEWMRAAFEHLIAFENVARGRPDQVAFQSWHTYPSRVLPETDDMSFTGFIERYFRERVR